MAVLNKLVSESDLNKFCLEIKKIIVEESELREIFEEALDELIKKQKLDL